MYRIWTRGSDKIMSRFGCGFFRISQMPRCPILTTSSVEYFRDVISEVKQPEGPNFKYKCNQHFQSERLR